MTDNTSDNVTVHINYERQTQPKQYETQRFSMAVTQSFPASLSPEEIDESAKVLAQVVKVAVYEQLQLPYEQNEDTKVIHEVFPGSQNVAASPKLAAVPSEPAEYTEAPTAPPVPQRTPQRRTGASRPATARPKPKGGEDDAWNDVMDHPENWYDNRTSKRNPNGPDFKATNASGWVNNRNEPMSLWINGQYSQAPEWFEAPDGGYAG